MPVKIDQRLGILAIDFQAIANRLFVVVFPLDQLTTSIRAFVEFVRCRKMDVQQFSSERAGTAACQSLHENIEIDVHEYRSIQRRTQCIEQFLKIERLLGRTRKAIQYETVFGIRQAKSFTDYSQHHFVRHQVSRVHYCPGL